MAGVGSCRPRTNVRVTLFTSFHVLLSLVGIVTGFVVAFGMAAGKPLGASNPVFLATTVATSVTGFLFPVHHLLPSHKVGLLSLVVLAIAIYAYRARRLAGGWRRTYAVTAVLALYLNVFVLVVQAFLKVPALHALAPQGSEPPFAIAEGVVLLLFVALGIGAARGFRGPGAPASA